MCVTPTAISSLVFLFCIFHHAHIMERHSSQSMLSKFALVFGVIAAMGAFAAGNCNVSAERHTAAVFLQGYIVSDLNENFCLRLC